MRCTIFYVGREEVGFGLSRNVAVRLGGAVEGVGGGGDALLNHRQLPAGWGWGSGVICQDKKHVQ